MNIKRAAIACIFMIFLVLTAHASMVSFFVIETGLSQEGERKRHSELWENTLLDVFFDAGYIVSNYPMIRLASIPDGNILDVVGFDLEEARDGGIDYVLITRLDYVAGVQAPQEVSFYLFKTTQHRIIYEKQISGNFNRPDRELTESLKSIIKELVPFFNNM